MRALKHDDNIRISFMDITALGDNIFCILEDRLSGYHSGVRWGGAFSRREVVIWVRDMLRKTTKDVL